MANIAEVIPQDLQEKYEFYDCNNALDILIGSFSGEWAELINCLRCFQISKEEIIISGGNKSMMPKKIDDMLFPQGWAEMRITGNLQIVPEVRSKRRGNYRSLQPNTITGFIEGHNVDFVKNQVAFDVEWNSKDQTFDRDLLAMRMYHECNVINVGVILTRAVELNDIFKELQYTNSKGEQKPVIEKFGKSTTEMDQLKRRLQGRRNGGCPVLAIGIKKKCVSDWEE
ncbi:MAG: BglII/BstYI family type II restriction endonuclease [Fusicatenibacter sp.]|nr:BglII/BstYI family type II restriction endonuclease [Fusicatenibacter sp.]